MERELEEERAAKRDLDRELDELVASHDEEAAQSQAEHERAIADLKAEFQETLKRTCKAAVL